jgi:peptidoglycan/LPS O-acetylase OafA/YrhL
MIEGWRVQIDGLRALSMIGVLFVHLWKNDPMTEDMRVSLFFIVSGFLITHILWNAKSHGGQIHVLNFYARRALRLFPALIVLVIVGVAFDMDGFSQVWPWHLFQASNIHFAYSKTVTPWVAGHLWSLNIIEQFYLIWPLVILFLSLRQIYVITIGLMLVGMFLHSHGGHFGIDGWWRFFVIPFDPILAGALTYLLARHADFVAVVSSTRAMIVALVVIFSPIFLWDGYSDSDTYRLLSQPALCAVVLGAFVGYRGPIGWALQNPVAVFLSKISYGVYMYHLAVWWLVIQVFPEYSNVGLHTFFVISGVTVIVATASWYGLEEPFSRLKILIPTRTVKASHSE